VAEYSGKLADPKFRQQRARDAALAAHSPAAHIRAIIRHAGKLTAEDIELLRSVLPAPKAGDHAAT
jgi:hypothetical protein